jgi:hypothetical protein
LTTKVILERLNPMDIRVIVFGMVVVLAFLFIGAKFFVPREKDRSKKEALFVEAIKVFKGRPSKENYDECIETARNLPQYKANSIDEIKKILKGEGITLS